MNMTLKKLLGSNIRKYRKLLNLSQEELAFRIGISAKHLSNIEVGKRFASAEIIEKIARELGVSVSSLFFEDYKFEDKDKIKAIEKIIDNEFKKLKNEIIKKIIEI